METVKKCGNGTHLMRPLRRLQASLVLNIRSVLSLRLVMICDQVGPIVVQAENLSN